MGRNAIAVLNHAVIGIPGYFQGILCTMSDTIADMTKGYTSVSVVWAVESFLIQ